LVSFFLFINLTFAQNIKCFVGKDSQYGSKILSKTCDEKFLVDFHDRLDNDQEHSEVIKKYRETISGEYFGKEKYLNLENGNNNFSIFKGFNGIIDVRENNKIEEINYLKVITQKNKNFFTKIGTKKGNIFRCDENNPCIVYGYEGSNFVRQNDDNKNLYFMDFDKNKDRIILEKDFNDDIEFGIENNLNFVAVAVNDNKVYLYGVSESDVVN
jgi:hypothetical protein